MTCEIIELSTFTRPSRSVSDKRPLGQRLREAKPELPPPATETAKNSRIRIKRRDAWWHADRMMDYWRARLDWQCALEIANNTGSPTATRSRRLRMKIDFGWSTNGARRLGRSC